MKYWEQLLIQWRANGNKGLSIPYIIGSQRYLPKDHIWDSINSLLVDVASSRNMEVFLSYCMNINDFILGIHSINHSPGAGFYPSLNSIEQKSLFVSDFLKLGDDVTSIGESLSVRLEDFMENEQYSINDRVRGSFTAEEAMFIIKCFSI
jgi:hypothetical protein